MTTEEFNAWREQERAVLSRLYEADGVPEAVRPLFLDVECGLASARLRLASTSRVMWRFAHRTVTLRALRWTIRRDPAAAVAVRARVAALLADETDPRYHNPHDYPIAAYLFALGPASEGLAETVARADPSYLHAAVGMARMLLEGAGDY